MMTRHCQIAVAIVVLFACAPLGRECLAKRRKVAVNRENIGSAVERGVAYIKGKQRSDGSWDGDKYDDGVTALAVYALIKAKRPLSDGAVSGGLKWMLKNPVPTRPRDAKTYSLSLGALALSAAIKEASGGKGDLDVVACKMRLREISRLLVAGQRKVRGKSGVIRGPKAKKPEDIRVEELRGGNGYDLDPFREIDGGAWGYDLANSRYVDNSNTQFALLALRAAQNVGDAHTGAGIAIPREVWVKALARLVAAQAAAGEWDYGTTAMGAKGFRDTMTAAGISGVVICLSSLEPGVDIGQVARTPEIVKALKKLERQVYPPANVVRFRSVGINQPNRTGYMFYSLERACMLSGLKRLGKHDWYADGAEELLEAQKADGSWSGAAWYSARASRHKAPRYRDNTIETAFCLLFLQKAFVPTPAHKEYRPE